MKKKFKHTLLAIALMFAIVGGVFGVRYLGLKEQESLKATRQAEIIAFWSNYESAKNKDSELAKQIKNDFVNRMSEDLSVDELLELVNETLENPITLEELINN